LVTSRIVSLGPTLPRTVGLAASAGEDASKSPQVTNRGTAFFMGAPSSGRTLRRAAGVGFDARSATVPSTTGQWS
jgi:hypothetical protein